MNYRAFLIKTSVILPLALFGSAWMIQLHYDTLKFAHVDKRAPVHRSILPASVVRHMAFGFDATLADYYFVSAVQAFLKWDGFDEYYPEYFRIISTLDPKFEYPYIFANLTIPNKINLESTRHISAISDTGISALPDNWHIPFTTAMAFHIVAKDNVRALHYLDIADKVPGAPEIVKRTHAIYLMRDASDYEKSRALFVTILETTDNEETKKIVTERLALLDLVEWLERGIVSFKAKHKSYPETVDVVLGKMNTPEVRALINKYKPTINQSTGKIILR